MKRRFGRSSNGHGDDAPSHNSAKVSLVELGTHVELAMVVGGYRDREQKLVEQLWEHLPADALLLEDPSGFFWLQTLENTRNAGHQTAHASEEGSKSLRPIERLPDGSFLSKIYPPSSRDRDRDRAGIVIRVIEYKLDDPQRTGHGETHRLATNLFDHTPFPALELVCEYQGAMMGTGTRQ